MEIKVSLFGGLRRYRPAGAPESGEFPFQLEEGSTVAEVMERLGLLSAGGRPFVNGEASPRERVLCSGDELIFMNPAGGG